MTWTNQEKICCSTRVLQEGYKSHEDRLLDVFIASNYCGDFDNRGAVLILDEHLQQKFVTHDLPFLSWPPEWSLLRTKTKIIRVWQNSVHLQLKSIQTSATECIRMPDIGLSSCCKDMDCMGFKSQSSVELPQFWGGGKKFAGWSTSFDRLRWWLLVWVAEESQAQMVNTVQ